MNPRARDLLANLELEIQLELLHRLRLEAVRARLGEQTIKFIDKYMNELLEK